MKIDMQEQRDTPFFWFLVEMLTAKEKHDGVDITQIVPIPLTGNAIDVELKINGHDMDIRWFVERAFKHVDDMAEKKAQKLFDAKMNEDIWERMNRISNILRDTEYSLRDATGLREGDE